MALNTQSFTSLVANWATVAQGAASQLVDFTIGSVLRAIDEATAYVALWLQGLIIQVQALSRAATSNGTDLDSWFAQFGFSRLAAVASTGQVTFARYTPTNQATIAIGSVVQSADGTVQYAVIVDTTNAAYSATAGAYLIPAGTASISVTVQCLTAGTVGNLAAGAINTLGTSISGVDYVSNAAAFANGVASETDTAARLRFILYIQALTAATLIAVQNAISSVEQGLTYQVNENQLYSGTVQNGCFTVVFNDGSGSPSSTLQTNVANAVNAVRPLGTTFSVHGPVVVSANIVMTLTTSSAYTHSAVVAAVTTALQTYIAALGMGQTLPYSMLASIAYNASAGVTNVTGITLNGGTSDLAVTTVQAIMAGTISVN